MKIILEQEILNIWPYKQDKHNKHDQNIHQRIIIHNA